MYIYMILFFVLIRVHLPNLETTRFLRNNPDVCGIYFWYRYLFQVQWSTRYGPRATGYIPIIHIQLHMFISSKFFELGKTLYILYKTSRQTVRGSWQVKFD
jgi:hypothetical protein